MAPYETYIGQISTYKEVQNSLFIILISILVPVGLIIGGIFIWSVVIASSIVMIVIGVLLFAIVGGLQTFVTADAVKIRFGLLRLRILNIKMADITTIGIRKFSPIKDFGGYGMRYGKGMKAYFLGGSFGVTLTLVNGKKYLIGSYQPEKLAAVIQAAVEHLTTGNEGPIDFSGVIPVNYQPPTVESSNDAMLKETTTFKVEKIPTV